MSKKESNWAIFADNACKGAKDFSRVIIPKKKPQNSNVTSAEKDTNKKIFFDQVIVENYFGRKVQLWGIMARKYKWNEGYFDSFSKLATALTNIHIRSHSLQNDLYTNN